MNLALFSNPAMENAKAGGLATADQVDAWNKQTGKRVAGASAGTNMFELTRPKNGATVFDCPARGQTQMSDEWKSDFKKKYVPNISE
jgi:hypothetical protein